MGGNSHIHTCNYSRSLVWIVLPGLLLGAIVTLLFMWLLLPLMGIAIAALLGFGALAAAGLIYVAVHKCAGRQAVCRYVPTTFSAALALILSAALSLSAVLIPLNVLAWLLVFLTFSTFFITAFAMAALIKSMACGMDKRSGG